MSIEAISAARKLTIPPRDKFVLIALCDYANDNGEAWPKQATLSEWTCYDRTTVNYALRDLEAAGLIVSQQQYREDGGKSHKVYHLAFLGTPHVAEDDKGMSQRTTRARRTPRQPHVAQHDSKNPQQLTTNKEPKDRRFDPLAVELPTFVSPQAWVDFVEHRREIRKKLTAGAVKKTLDKLAATPKDANEMLNRAVANGWTGVYALDKKRGPPEERAASQATDLLSHIRSRRAP